jgi:hypothetical protein
MNFTSFNNASYFSHPKAVVDLSEQRFGELAHSGAWWTTQRGAAQGSDTILSPTLSNCAKPPRCFLCYRRTDWKQRLDLGKRIPLRPNACSQRKARRTSDLDLQHPFPTPKSQGRGESGLCDPPGKHLTATNGHLRLTEVDREHGHRVAIDLFFRRWRTRTDRRRGDRPLRRECRRGDRDPPYQRRRQPDDRKDEAEHASMPRAAINRSFPAGRHSSVSMLAPCPCAAAALAQPRRRRP